MTFEELQDSWKRDVSKPLSAEEQASLLSEFQKRSTAAQRAVRQRDWIETIAAVFVVIAFSAMLPSMRRSWISMLGCIEIIVWAIAVVILLWRYQRQPTADPNQPAREHVQQQLHWNRQQQRLLKLASIWYVAPCIIGALLIMWGTVRPGDERIFLQVASFVLAFGVLLVWHNWRVAHRYWQPLIDELERVASEL